MTVSAALDAQHVARSILRRAIKIGHVCVYKDPAGVWIGSDTPLNHARRNPQHLIGVYTENCPQEWIADDLMHAGYREV